MPRRSVSRRLAALLLPVLLMAPASLPALDELSIQAGRMLLSNPAAQDQVSPLGAPSPWLVMAGAAVPLISSGLFRLELGALIWGTLYELVDATAVMVPTQVETAHQVGVLGLWLSPLAGIRVPIADGRIELGATAGLSLNFRFPLYETDLAAGEAAQRVAAGYRYFWAGRFLFPETRLSFRWLAFDDFALRLSVTALYPLFHLWDGGAFLDQLTVAVLFGFDFRFPGSRKAAGAAGKAAR